MVLKRWWPTYEQLGYWQPTGKFVQSEMTSATAVESRYIIWHFIITYSGYSIRIWSSSSYCNNLNDSYAESSKHASSQTYLDGKCMILQGKQIGMRLDKGEENKLAVISLPQPFCILKFLAVFTETDAIQAIHKALATFQKTELQEVKSTSLILTVNSSFIIIYY